MKTVIALATLMIMAIGGDAVAARLNVRIDISQQTMAVTLDGKGLYTWPVSTGRSGYRTPTGTFTPQRLEREWYSTKYDYAPMPWSIFFYGGYAIHGTTDIKNLGQPASHGCVRLHPDNARALFQHVLAVGRTQTTIRIVP